MGRHDPPCRVPSLVVASQPLGKPAVGDSYRPKAWSVFGRRRSLSASDLPLRLPSSWAAASISFTLHPRTASPLPPPRGSISPATTRKWIRYRHMVDRLFERESGFASTIAPAMENCESGQIGLPQVSGLCVQTCGRSSAPAGQPWPNIPARAWAPGQGATSPRLPPPSGRGPHRSGVASFKAVSICSSLSLIRPSIAASSVLVQASTRPRPAPQPPSTLCPSEPRRGGSRSMPADAPRRPHRREQRQRMAPSGPDHPEPASGLGCGILHGHQHRPADDPTYANAGQVIWNGPAPG